MRIAIIGTRGIPNRYGGFEQFAEYAAPMLAEKGHEVYVYNSSLHPYKESKWKSVHLIRKFDPELRWGTIGQFIYDFNCIRDARKQKFDIILQLGYTSSSVWSFLFPKDAIVMTNMDGFEWQRKKYSRPVQWFLKRAERWAVTYSDFLIADSIIIQSYLKKKYSKEARYIPYGAHVFYGPDEKLLGQFKLVKYGYHLVVSRMEKENHIETIIEGYLNAGHTESLVIIGNYSSRYGRYLKRKYEDRIMFLGPIYNLEILNQLRYFSKLYFHGHSVGGTNPSLLEAMASQALIVAHDNPFNRRILGENAIYFLTSKDISSILEMQTSRIGQEDKISRNMEVIEKYFSWQSVIEKLEDYFMVALNRTKQSLTSALPALAQKEE